MSWYQSHRARLDEADAASRARSAYSPFVESPRRSLHPDGAKQRGLDWFEAVKGGDFGGTAPDESRWAEGEEVSPLTLAPLGIRYARPTADQVADAAAIAWPSWRAASPTTRLGVCLEALNRLAGAVFENAFATMHTTGQPFLMAFAGSGANSLDRGLEALVYARRAMEDVPQTASFRRSFGPAAVEVEKRYRLMPRGLAVVIACGSYPAWNVYPALFANLATGNPVVLKPHPATILPMARATEIVRGTLREAGFDPNLLILATDSAEAPITDALVDHPMTAIVDFTGSPTYGERLEARADRLVFTETAGCNAVLLESVADLEPVLDAIVHGLCLFSGQMCTTPQNLFVPPEVKTRGGVVAFAEVRERLIAKIDALAADPPRAAGTFGALHSDATVRAVEALATRANGRVLRAAAPYAHPEYENARTLTPLLIEDAVDSPLHQREHFGPVGFLIPTRDRAEAVERAAAEANRHGAIASYAYSTDDGFCETVEAAFFSAGASIGFNLVGHRPINFTAAFSDYHVTGLTPAGNACLTDLAFVASRFRIVQSKRERSR